MQISTTISDEWLFVLAFTEAATYYDERHLAALVLMIGVANLFNRIIVTTKQGRANGLSRQKPALDERKLRTHCSSGASGFL